MPSRLMSPLLVSAWQETSVSPQLLSVICRDTIKSLNEIGCIGVPIACLADMCRDERPYCHGHLASSTVYHGQNDAILLCVEFG